VNAAQLRLLTALADHVRTSPSSSLEFYQRTAPPPTSPPCVHSQKRSSLRLSAPFDQSIPSNRSVPSSPFLTTSTVCSARSFAGLLHPATSHGVHPVSSSLLSPQATSQSQSASQQFRNPHRSGHPSLPIDFPRFQFTIRRPCTAPAKAQEKEQYPSPRAHPPFEAFPSNSAVLGSPSHSVLPHRMMPPPSLPLSLLLGASFFHVPPDPFPVPAFPGVQVTALNHRGLSRARVRCTNTSFPAYPCPLLPWACQAPVLRCPGIMRPYPKSKFDNRTETRPDAPTFDGRGSRSPSSPKASSKAPDVPTSSRHPAVHYSRNRNSRPSYCVQVCGVP